MLALTDVFVLTRNTWLWHCVCICIHTTAHAHVYTEYNELSMCISTASQSSLYPSRLHTKTTSISICIPYMYCIHAVMINTKVYDLIQHSNMFTCMHTIHNNVFMYMHMLCLHGVHTCTWIEICTVWQLLHCNLCYSFMLFTKVMHTGNRLPDWCNQHGTDEGPSRRIDNCVAAS